MRQEKIVTRLNHENFLCGINRACTTLVIYILENTPNMDLRPIQQYLEELRATREPFSLLRKIVQWAWSDVRVAAVAANLMALGISIRFAATTDSVITNVALDWPFWIGIYGAVASKNWAIYTALLMGPVCFNITWLKIMNHPSPQGEGWWIFLVLYGMAHVRLLRQENRWHLLCWLYFLWLTSVERTAKLV